MPKTGRPRGRAGLTAVAMVPREHAAPAAEAPVAPPRPASGRARRLRFADRLPIAVLAFLIGFASCYVVLRYSAGPDTTPYARATSSSSDAAMRRP